MYLVAILELFTDLSLRRNSRCDHLFRFLAYREAVTFREESVPMMYIESLKCGFVVRGGQNGEEELTSLLILDWSLTCRKETVPYLIGEMPTSGTRY